MGTLENQENLCWAEPVEAQETLTGTSWSDASGGSCSGAMFGSFPFPGAGSCIAAGSIFPSAEGSGVISVQRDHCWLGSGFVGGGLESSAGVGRSTVFQHPLHKLFYTLFT